MSSGWPITAILFIVLAVGYAGASAFVHLRLRYWQRQVRKAEAQRDALDAELAKYR